MTLLDSTPDNMVELIIMSSYMNTLPDRCGSILALAIHILTPLHQHINNIPQTGYGSVVECAVAELVTLVKVTQIK